MADFEMHGAVIFRLGDELYAFPIEVMHEINIRDEYTCVPGLPDCMQGVINLMGDVIPVIDLRRRLGLPEAENERHSCLMVISSGSDMAAVKVDEALVSLPHTDDDEFVPLEEESIVRGFLTHEDGRRVLVLDEEKVLDINGVKI